MSIILIGPSGAGKGTQADKLAPKYGLQHLSTGDLFRDSLEKETALGILAKKYLTQGELVPDEVADAMVEEYLRKADPHRSILFDGYPRTLYQAKALEELFSGMNRTLDAIIYLKVSDDEVVRRLPERLVCRQCQTPFHKQFNPFTVCHRCGSTEAYHRTDDTLETIQARLRVFHRETAPVVEYYQKQDQLIIVDGEGTIDEVYHRMVETIESLKRQEQKMATRADIRQIQLLKKDTAALTPAETRHHSLDIVLLGAPGSGKGTQAGELSSQLGLTRIATGDLFRQNLKRGTELGKVAKAYINRGELVPDDVTQAMVKERLARPDTNYGFILDGFPRTLPQAQALTEMMTNMGRRLNGVLYIKVSDEEIVNRLLARVICRECQTPFHKIYNPFTTCPHDKCVGQHLYQRDDDKPETVHARLRTFHRQTAPLVDYYRQAGLLMEIEGEGEITEIKERSLQALEALIAKERVLAP